MAVGFCVGVGGVAGGVDVDGVFVGVGVDCVAVGVGVGVDVAVRAKC